LMNMRNAVRIAAVIAATAASVLCFGSTAGVALVNAPVNVAPNISVTTDSFDILEDVLEYVNLSVLGDAGTNLIEGAD